MFWDLSDFAVPFAEIQKKNEEPKLINFNTDLLVKKEKTEKNVKNDLDTSSESEDDLSLEQKPKVPQPGRQQKKTAYREGLDENQQNVLRWLAAWEHSKSDEHPVEKKVVTNSDNFQSPPSEREKKVVTSSSDNFQSPPSERSLAATTSPVNPARIEPVNLAAFKRVRMAVSRVSSVERAA